MINKIIEIAEEAGKILLKHRGGDLNIETKNGEFDFVTKADLEADAFIRAELTKNFPEILILSEESKDIPNDFTGDVFMVDLLDGTKGYINGNSGFAVMIGLCRHGKPILGVVYAPARDKLYYAEKSKGAYLKEKGEVTKISVSNIYSLADSKLITYHQYGEKRKSDEMLEKMPVLEHIPESSAGVKLCLVAEGKAEIHIHTNSRGSKWDTCAPQIILEESGGKLTTHNGNGLDYLQESLDWTGGFVGTNTYVHESVIEYLKSYK